MRSYSRLLLVLERWDGTRVLILNRHFELEDGSVRSVLSSLTAGEISMDVAVERLQQMQGFVGRQDSTTDTDRLRRRGIPEIVYGAGKTSEQIVEVLEVLRSVDQMGLVTRLDREKSVYIKSVFEDALYDERARCLSIGHLKTVPQMFGRVAVVSAGTSDLNVAAEAVFCLRAFGNEVLEFRDVGVSGIHRLLDVVPAISESQVVITIAGFEAALPTVLGGLIDRPIIAVPTSVGYGASFGGVTALLGMLNACAPGMSVVNIDNGFGAAYAATLMNRRPSAL